MGFLHEEIELLGDGTFLGGFVEVGHAHRVVAAGGRPVGIDRATLGSDKGAAALFVKMELDAGQVGFFQEGRGGEAEQEFRGWQVERLAEAQDVVRSEDDIDIAAAGGETGDPRMAAEFEFALQGQFLGQNMTRVGREARKIFVGGVLFCGAHGCFLSSIAAAGRSGGTVRIVNRSLKLRTE